MESFYVGTDLKFKITLTATGFSQADDDYTIHLTCGKEKRVIHKSDILEDDGDYYLVIDTSTFPSGVLRMTVFAEVEDESFDDVIRTETASIDLCQLKYT